MRDNLKQVERQTGQKLIHQPDTPRGAEYLLGWFWELTRGRARGLSGPEPLSAQEVKAWSELNGIELEPFEFAAIREMDAAYMKTAQEIQAKAKGRKNG